ncbi:MAG TPA: SCP2 sterol-binding domain-containing protein, partial [Solirubrobacteraceae bacterium]|nr:SCP2 sterol-binding domain-containing protein [Solirubrobacteraceae bacterium]
EAALARRDPPRSAPPGYRIDEPAEVERAHRVSLPPPGKLLRAIRAQARHSARRRAMHALARVLDGRADDEIEARFGSPIVQRGLFAAMASSFEPRYAFGFEGEIQYELTSNRNGGAPERWTIEIRNRRATAHRRAAREPAVTLRLQTADLLRLAAGANPGAVLLTGRTEVEGDFSVAMRLPEMFGAPSPY